MSKKEPKTLSLPRHAAYLRIGPTKSILILCNDVVRQLKEIREESADEWGIEYGEESGDSWLKMFDQAIAEWQKGADKVEADIEFGWLMFKNSERYEAENAIAEREERGLPAVPRQTKAYAKRLKCHVKFRNKHAKEKAAELALNGLQQAEGAAP